MSADDLALILPYFTISGEALARSVLANLEVRVESGTVSQLPSMFPSDELNFWLLPRLAMFPPTFSFYEIRR